jgi:Glycosyl transferases group 1
MDNDILLDAMQRSAYTKVMESYLYSSNNITHPMHLLYQQHYHDINSLNPAKPIVFVVDWTALLRDCHVLQRIVYYILHNSYFGGTETHHSRHHNNNNVYMLLLDASASSQAITCQDSVLMKQLIPNSHQNIRLAKRSIITNRQYNYTKQWIESGALIPNQNHNNHILHWSGYVSQLFVQLLDIAVNDFTERSKKLEWRRRRQQQRNSKKSHNSHYRPIDVTHYWKAVASNDPSLIKNEYQYYYNRLRQTVQQQINVTHQIILKHSYTHNHNSEDNSLQTNQEEVRDNALSRWVEFVGIDTQVEFVQNDSSADGSDTSRNTNDDRNVDELDARSTLHVAVLASSKIVVVTQADEYEDHDTRLLEAMSSGAMVLCDMMIAPPLGLVHKTNIVFFDSASKLDQYLQFYLDPENDKQRQEIARHGVEYALGRHRSWHVLEALLFGKALTRTDKHPLTDIGPKVRKSTVKSKYPELISLT